ncbi:MAG TPA: DUF3822 family protein, partial [Chitinophagaceae bacterium]|nr:DUF3822 family protein [Chitinophagaceae bacterium]
QCSLIIDAGVKHFNFAVLSRESNEYVALEYYQFREKYKEEELRELLSSHTLLQLDYRDVTVFYNSANGLLIPERYYDQDSSDRMLELIAGDTPATMPFFDALPELNLRNVYAIPTHLHEVMVAQFPRASYEHVHTGLLKKNSILNRKDDRIEVVFYPEQLIISVWLRGKLQILQCFYYETPDDITWYLLDICKQWDVDHASMPVVVSGLVEQHSALYSSIDRYFKVVHTEDRPEAFNYDIAFDRYPEHFFSPLFSLGLCVS